MILYAGLDNSSYSEYISEQVKSYRFWHLLFLGPFKLAAGVIFLALGRNRDVNISLYYPLNGILLFIPLVSCFWYIVYAAITMNPFNSYDYFKYTLGSFDSILEIIYSFVILIIQFLRITGILYIYKLLKYIRSACPI